MPDIRASDVVQITDLLAATSNAADKCRANRRKVLKGALVAFNARHCSIPCTVKEISASGARIRSEHSNSIPDTFELIIDLDGVEVDCEVVWRKDSVLGVRFLGAPRHVSPKRQQSVLMTTAECSNSLRRRPKTVSPR